MMLARVIGSVAEKNWSSVLLEFVVVVVGIFLGLQATEWYENRQARADETYYLELLQSQLDSEIGLLDEVLINASDSIDRIRNAYEALFADEWSEDEYSQFRSDHVAIYSMHVETMRPSALRLLLDGGKIELIQSKAMQELIFDLDRAYGESISQGEISAKHLGDLILELEIPYGTKEELMAIPVEASVLLESNKLKKSIRSMLIVHRIQRSALEAHQQALVSARDELGIVLTRHSP